jgi:hypothetical protein
MTAAAPLDARLGEAIRKAKQDVVPHIIIRSSRPRYGPEKLCSVMQKDLQHDPLDSRRIIAPQRNDAMCHNRTRVPTARLLRQAYP